LLGANSIDDTDEPIDTGKQDNGKETRQAQESPAVLTLGATGVE
jgi:hypothetical protein